MTPNRDNLVNQRNGHGVARMRCVGENPNLRGIFHRGSVNVRAKPSYGSETRGAGGAHIMDLEHRHDEALNIVREAGDIALRFFRHRDRLKIETKGHQDFVSQADKEVELAIRDALSRAFRDDGIVGEEHAPVRGSSGFDWVIDPIDGTTNFVNGIPAWTVVLAGVFKGKTRIGIIHDPVHGETFAAMAGHGATLNGAPLRVAPGHTISDGSTGVGYCNRVAAAGTVRLIEGLLEKGGLFQRNASGALSLAYVAAGRLIGFAEEHMNAWDCLAGQLIVAEAGGLTEPQDADAMIASGGRVIVGLPGVFDDLLQICEAAFSAPAMPLPSRQE